MLRKVLLSAALIVGIAAAPAAAQYPGFVITPGSARPGDSVSFTGSGCEPGELVNVGLMALFEGQSIRQVGEQIQVAKITADENGNFSGSFVVPDLAPGRYKVIASCGIVQSAELEILSTGLTADPDDPDDPRGPGATGGTGASQGGGRSGPLPATGSDFNALGLVGLALLAAGGLVLLTTRNRSTRPA